MRSEQKSGFMKQKYLLPIILVGAMVVCFVAAFLVPSVIHPAVVYNKAIRLMEAEEYETAIATFGKIDDYKDSSSQIAACHDAISERQYQAALALLNSEEYEAAIAAFGKIDDYKDSSARIAACYDAIAEKQYQEELE